MSVREPGAPSAVVGCGGEGGADLDRRVDDVVRRRGRLVEGAAVVDIPADEDVADDEVIPQDEVAVVHLLVAVRGDVLPGLAEHLLARLVQVAHAVGDLLDHDDRLDLHLRVARSLRRHLLHVDREGDDEGREQEQRRCQASQLLPRHESVRR